MAETAKNENVATRLALIADMMPGAVAIAEPKGRAKPGATRSYAITTFRGLDERSDAIARGLQAWGVQPGMRLAMLVPFGTQFIELVFALLKAGAVVVLVDPGIGRQHLIECLAQSQPDGIVGIPKAHLFRLLFRRRFARAKWNVAVAKHSYGLADKSIRALETLGVTAAKESLPFRALSDDAAVIFTSGSTGPPKGVLYTQGIFHAQIDRIRDRYQIRPGSRDLACFPLFGLFDAMMGVTTVIPDMDPTRPANVDPRRLIDAVRQWEVDQAFGSPALWNRVARWSERATIAPPFPTLRRVLSAGAPVPVETLERLRRLVHPDAEIATPYGATEALPIASIESREIITETGPAAAKGKGICVGTRFPDVQWRVIDISDEALSTIDQTRERPVGKIGELLVSGPMVSRSYVVRQDQNQFHKVADGDVVWHRMGDVGYLDDQDRFWFCGRKAQRVQTEKRTLYTIPCEAVFNAHPAVYRSALVGRGDAPGQTPVIIVEPNPEQRPRDEVGRQRLIAELLSLATRNPLTRIIEEIVIWDRPLPVDIRHNSKIFREQLTAELNRR